MKETIKRIIYGLGAGISTTLVTISDEVMKLPAYAPISDIDQRSIFFAAVGGIGVAFGIWKALVTPVKEG